MAGGGVEARGGALTLRADLGVGGIARGALTMRFGAVLVTVVVVELDVGAFAFGCAAVLLAAGFEAAEVREAALAMRDA